MYGVKWSIASLMSSKLEPVIWLRVLVTLAYMKGRTDVRTYGRPWRHGYKTKFSHIDGLPYITMGLRARAPSARAELRYEKTLTSFWQENALLLP